MQFFQGGTASCRASARPGPARNKGAAAALAPIVAFIDADCLAQPGWIRGIRSFFEERTEISVLAGSIGIAMVRPDHPTELELYESIYGYRVGLYVERDHYAATGNMAVRRRGFEAVGPFGGIATMEDRAWGRRAKAAGLKIAFAPAVRVLTPACKDFDELGRRWDRHIAHEFKELSPGAPGVMRWLVASIAVAISPIVEACRLIFTGRGPSLAKRLMVLGVVGRLRLHRARAMLAHLFDNQSTKIVNSWNRS